MYLFGSTFRRLFGTSAPSVTDSTSKDSGAHQKSGDSNSSPSAVTEFRSIKHSHSWTIKAFSQGESKYKETVFKPICSSNDVSPTFRVRLLPIAQDYVHIQVFSDDLTAKYFAKINLYNGRNEKIITKTYNDVRRTDHVEQIPRQTLLSKIGPEDELRIEVDLTVTFDATVIEGSSQTGSKTEPTAVRGGKRKKRPQGGKQIPDKTIKKAAATSYPSGLNKSLPRTAFISLSKSGSDTQHAEVALMDSGAFGSIIKPSAAQVFGTWTKPKALISSISGVGGVGIPIEGQLFLDVRIGNLVLNRQRFLVADIKMYQDVILGTDFHDAVGSVTFHKDSMQVNGETIPYASGVRGNSVVCKSIRTDKKETPHK